MSNTSWAWRCRSIFVTEHDGTSAVREAVQWLHHVDRTFSTYIDDSPISRLGRGDITLDDVSDEVTGVLLLCEQLCDDTEGTFDAFAVPNRNGSTLDPSGVVKGWSIERAAELLESHGHTDFTINAGGDIAVRGEAAPNQPWRIGIRHPDSIGQLADVLTACRGHSPLRRRPRTSAALTSSTRGPAKRSPIWPASPCLAQTSPTPTPMRQQSS